MSEKEKFEVDFDRLDTPGLAMKYADHKALGSTPPEKMKLNPEKTQLELETDDELEQYIAASLGSIEGFKAAIIDPPPTTTRENMQRIYEEAMEDLRANLHYMKENSRLPEKYKDLDIDKIGQ